MNTAPDDDNPLTDASFDSFRRAMRRFQWFVWVGVIACFVLPFAARALLPQPIRTVVLLSALFIFILGIFGFLCRVAPHHPLVKRMRPAARRYMMRFLPAMLLYVAVLEAATWCYRRWHPSGVEAVLVALAPALLILFAIRAMMLFLKEESDEFLRSRMLEGWAIATCLALAVCTVWGFLDQFEVVPHLPLWAAFPLWAGCLMPAHFLLQRRDA